MKKIVISFFIVLILIVVASRLLTPMVSEEVIRNIKSDDKTITESSEEPMEGIKYEDLEWGYDDLSEWSEENFQATGGDIDEDGGFFIPHDLMSFEIEGDQVEVKEDFFVSHFADIYLNAPKYLGKNIKYEGMFFSIYDENTNKTYKYVLRYGPGCCTYDDQVGLEVETNQTFEDKTWVSVSGSLSEYQGEQYKHLILEVDELEIKEERGLETVYR